MKMRDLKIVLICVFCISSNIFASPGNPIRSQTVCIEHKAHNPYNGLFCKLCQIMEWIYCAEHHEEVELYINLCGVYESNNLFTSLFRSVPHPRIKTDPPNCATIQVVSTPGESSVPGYGGKENVPGVNPRSTYGNCKFFTSPAFSLHRNQMSPIIAKYFQPVDEVQQKIDAVLQKMRNSELGDQKDYVVGIHVRQMHQLVGYDKSQEQFLKGLENDIDQLMKSKDPRTTKIFLATLLQPVVDMVTAKYDHVIVCDVPRCGDARTDWFDCPRPHSFDSALNAVVDMWCLANCDEVWGGSSNMLVFTGCINPHVKISLLPSIASYNGG